MTRRRIKPADNLAYQHVCTARAPQTGLAQVLLNRAEDYARSLQLKHIYLYAQSRGLLQKRGWLVLKTVNLDGQN